MNVSISARVDESYSYRDKRRHMPRGEQTRNMFNRACRATIVVRLKTRDTLHRGRRTLKKKKPPRSKLFYYGNKKRYY